MTREPPHPDDIEDATDAALIAAELSTRDISRIDAQMTSFIIVGEVDYWDSDTQQSCRFNLWYEVDFHSGNAWLKYQQSRHGSDEFPEDWEDLYEISGGY